MQLTAPDHRSRRRLATLLAGGVVALFAALAPAANASVYQWTLDFPSGVPMYTNTSFSLKNEDVGDVLVYSQRPWYSCGIDLGWTDNKTWQWRFRRQGGATGPLRFGERVALRNMKTGSYLHYESRPCGINLTWTSSPDYDWIIKGGTNGTGVTHQSDNALFNVSEPDYLVYGWRSEGVNLRWWDDLESKYCYYHDYC